MYWEQEYCVTTLNNFEFITEIITILINTDIYYNKNENETKKKKQFITTYFCK